ncbi:MAG: hypothetical protein ACRERC_02845 [Candidatus Binatia bacterium]
MNAGTERSMDQQVTSAESPRGPFALGPSVIDDLMAGGELLPTQMPSPTHWSAEKKLAAAVLASALVEIRDHHGSPAHRRRVAEALEWVHGEDEDWPYTFLRLCALFGLEAEWVRAEVARWIETPRGARKGVTFLYRQAA